MKIKIIKMLEYDRIDISISVRKHLENVVYVSSIILR